MSRATLVAAYFAAIKRVFEAETVAGSKRALRLAKRISLRLERIDRPRFWWVEQ